MPNSPLSKNHTFNPSIANQNKSKNLQSPYSPNQNNFESSKSGVGILASADNIYQQIRRQIDDLSPITKNTKNQLDNIK